MDMDILKDTVKLMQTLMQTPPWPTPVMDMGRNTVKLMQNSLMPNSAVLLIKLVTTTGGFGLAVGVGAVGGRRPTDRIL